MLQQTQVATVLPYYERWMRRFPTVEDLARAEIDDVLALWQGLGYYRRCRNLLAGAKWIGEHGMPQSREAWRNVPGVGDYTSAAIASICFGEPVAVVDGNVERVHARHCASELVGSRLRRQAQAWAQDLLVCDHPCDFNQAMMELGARVCRPRNPQCQDCPLNISCLANRSGTQSEFPRRTAPIQVREIDKHFVIHTNEDRVVMVRIPDGQWAEGMWSFPEVVPEPCDRPLVQFSYQVTHHRISATASVRETRYQGDGTEMTPEEVEAAALPAPQRKIWEAYKASYAGIKTRRRATTASR
ncbi:MAG: Endonuclease III [Fimbriimonadaceae bacterium]|nr:Endonuclease III [Fimbriimonadaceae bacterium]